MKALVTGGAGFIGSHIVDLLVFEGHDVAVVDNLASGSIGNVNANARFHQVDVASLSFGRVLRFERPEVVFHHAAQKSLKASIDDPLYGASVNVLGTVNVLEACLEAGVRKVVFGSSAEVYGAPIYLPIDENHPVRPNSPFGIARLAAEHYLSYYALARGLQYTVLRYAHVYGPRQRPNGEGGVVATFAQHLLAGQTSVVPWDADHVRDYVYVADVVLANLLAASGGDGRTYCIGTGVGTPASKVLRLVSESTGIDALPRLSPQPQGDVRTAYVDAARAQAELGWRATVPLHEGIAKTVDSLRRRLSTERREVLLLR